MRCSVDWRRLGLLMGVDPPYHDLRESHSEYERVTAICVAATASAATTSTCARTASASAASRLRAHAPVFIEWLRIDYRQGWLPGITPKPVVAVRDTENAQLWWNGMLDKRRELGLDLPYGPPAHREKLGELLPPSERDK